MNWDSVALRHGTDKASGYHSYMEHYQKLLENRPVDTLLEIGVLQGLSLFTWAELLPEALIVGIDVEPNCRYYQRDNIAVIIADATNKAKMEALTTLHGPFDVIIDDGSHDPSEIWMAFDALYPLMPKGGLYIIEDLFDDDPFLQQLAEWPESTIIPCVDGCLIVMEHE
jgi:predicted O-methyltransferase YrrM